MTGLIAILRYIFCCYEEDYDNRSRYHYDPLPTSTYSIHDNRSVVERGNSLRATMAEEAKEKGDAAFSTGRFTDAVRFYSNAISLNPTNPVLYSNRSSAYASLHQYSKAMDDSNKKLELKTNLLKGNNSSLSPSHESFSSKPRSLYTSTQTSSPSQLHGPSSSKQHSLYTSTQPSCLSPSHESSSSKPLHTSKQPSSSSQTNKSSSSKPFPLYTSTQPSTLSPSHGPPSSKPHSLYTSSQPSLPSPSNGLPSSRTLPPLTSMQPSSLSLLEPSNADKNTWKNGKKTKKTAKIPEGIKQALKLSDASVVTEKSLKNEVSVFEIPKDLKQMFGNGVVPPVLRTHLTQLTYKHYFATLLYAEDFYIEKWSEFCLCNVTLELHKSTKRSYKKNMFEIDEDDEEPFVSFEIDSIPERRPFLLSRDFVLLRPAGMKVEPFRGSFFRVVKSKHVWAEFGYDFHSQHSPNKKYDISFSFNRVCLKRCHQAVATVTDPLFQNFLFPSRKSRVSIPGLPPSFIHSHQNLTKEQASAVYTISRLKDPPPYLIEGPLSVREKRLSTTGLVIKEAVLEIYRTTPGCRILVNAPVNSTCDVLMRSLMEGEIPEHEIFRANAAFRELDGVPDDILPLCPFKRERFMCPSLKQLQNFKVILSTYVSSFRLHNEGFSAGHFSHIFMVDASSATEPEIMVSLVNMADEKTVIIVNGAIRNHSTWVRSDIARKNRLKMSYFQRLLEREPWCSNDPMFVMHFNEQGAISLRCYQPAEGVNSTSPYQFLWVP